MLFRYAQSDNQIGQLEADESDNAGPDNRQTHAEELHPDLMAHGDALRIADAAQ